MKKYEKERLAYYRDKIEQQREAASERQKEKAIDALEGLKKSVIKPENGDIWMKIIELEQKVDDNHAGIGACLETFAKELMQIREKIEALESRQTFKMVHFCKVKDCGHAQSVKIDLDEMARLRDLGLAVPKFWKCSVCNEKNEYHSPIFYIREAEIKNTTRQFKGEG